MSDSAMLSVELDKDQATALAKFLNRVGWSEIRGNSANEDEAYLIKYAIAELSKGLSDAGVIAR